MKSIKVLMTAALIGMMVTACDDDKVITAEQLPAPAKAYIEKTYPNASIVFAKEDKEVFSTKYKVQLDNRVVIEFDSEGAVTDIDME